MLLNKIQYISMYMKFKLDAYALHALFMDVLTHWHKCQEL